AGAEIAAFPLRLHFSGTGAGQDMLARLEAHWKKFAAETKTPPSQQVAEIRFILLGKNEDADALARQYAGPALDSIGQEGYVMVVNKQQRFLAARSETGLFYGLQTLKQLTRAGWNRSLAITDWPAFA